MVENKIYVVKSGKVSYSKRDRVEYLKTVTGYLITCKKVVPNINDFVTIKSDKIVYNPTLISKLEGLKKQAVGDSQKVISHLLTSLKNILGLNADKDKTKDYKVYNL